MDIHPISAFLAVAPYILILVPLIILYITLIRRYQQKEARDNSIRNHGIHATARITSLHRGVLTKDLIYTYEHQEKPYTQVQYITPNAFKNAKEGSDTIVYYLPDNPQQSILVDFDRYSLEHKAAQACFIIILIYISTLIFFGALDALIIHLMTT